MKGKAATFVSALVSAPFVLVLAVALVTILAVSGPIFEAVDANQGPGNAGKGDIDFGGAILLFASAGLISVPAALFLKLMLGGNRREQPMPQRRGPF